MRRGSSPCIYYRNLETEAVKYALKTFESIRNQSATHIMESIAVDVLVCGGGMSGMACAAFAAQSGARVLVVEKQDTVGGSSNYSAGMLYVFHILRGIRTSLLTTSVVGLRRRTTN